uniref:Uncharacterized protein n=1 Tax=Musa acuminata TaxID=4641 RepID=Q1EPF7_MUSAC|nr:hypothetical protein MA4_106O17.70 [Musa acuminata]
MRSGRGENGTEVDAINAKLSWDWAFLRGVFGSVMGMEEVAATGLQRESEYRSRGRKPMLFSVHKKTTTHLRDWAKKKQSPCGRSMACLPTELPAMKGPRKC